jgi:hypothetical protein
MLHIAPSPALKQRTPQAMSIDPESVRLSPFLQRTTHRLTDVPRTRSTSPGAFGIARIALQEGSPNTTRRPYVCPPLWVNCTPVPQHWDLSSGDNHLDIDEEDGYVLSANEEGLTCGAFVACEPLTAVRRARPGRLRIKPWILHRRRISPTATTVSFLLSPLPSPLSTYRSVFSTNRLLLSLHPISASTIASLRLSRRPTRTSRTCSTASVNAIHSLSTPQRQRLPRRHRSHYPSHLPFHLRCRARPLLRASSDPCSTCRRVRPWGRAPRPLRQRYPPLVPALPSSGPLGGCLSAHPSRFGPQNIILGLLWFDSRINHGFPLRGPLIMSVTCVIGFSIVMCIRACTRLYSHRNVYCIDIAFPFGDAAHPELANVPFPLPVGCRSTKWSRFHSKLLLSQLIDI